MSAVATIVRPDRVDMYADAAFYDPSTGILTAIEPKIYRVPRSNAVFSSRGKAGAFGAFLLACDETEYDGFDGFRRATDAVFERFDAHGYKGEIIVAGWSDENARGEVLFRKTHGKDDGIDAGTIYLMGERTGFGVDYEKLDDPITAFEESRRMEVDLSCGEGEPFMAHSVGGFIGHAVVTPEGVTGEIVKVWPDRVGEKITPASVAAANFAASGN